MSEPHSPYKPISDYGFIGDCRTGALIGRDGAVDWLCLPEFFNDSLFAAILDARQGGRFRIGPAGPYEVSRRYLGESAVLETTFHCPDGVFRVTDCMPVIGSDGDKLQPERELLRAVEVLEGGPRIQVDFEPRPDYGRLVPRIRRLGKLGWRFETPHRVCHLGSELELEPGPQDASLHGRFRLPPGSRRYLSLTATERDVAVLPLLGAPAAERIGRTRAWWTVWSGKCRYEGPYREMVLRSAITLKLLDYSLSGAVLAAPTASLPEEIGGKDNWDYRYCWLRDAAFTLRAFLELGYVGEARDFFGWLLHATRLTWPKLDVMYGVYGGQPSREEVLAHLDGYEGSRPVRVGNQAREQVQLDVYGEVVLAVYDYIRGGGKLDRYEKRLVRGFGDTVCQRWREPDNGIWEVRGEPRHYTYSKLMCWAALDCLIRLHERGELQVPVERFRRAREEIAQSIEEKAFRRDLNAYMGIFETEEADAALLQLDRVGFKPADDPAVEGTYRYISERLGDNGLLRRYTTGYNPQQGREGAFGVCGFWAVSHLVRSGRLAEADEKFRHLLSYANDLGLYAEETDPRSGRALGNFPQAFTHVGLIHSALALAGRESRQGGGQEAP